MKEEEREKVQEALSEIITRTFEKLVATYGSHKEKHNNVPIEVAGGSRLIFPCYGEHHNPKCEVRVSEQELRFAFVEAFYEYCRKEKHLELFYSVETPTELKYSFKDTPRKCEDNECNCKSGSFDLVIHDNQMNRIAYIEFKANNAGKKEHLKDFCKLQPKDQYDSSLKYFIEIVSSYNDSTRSNLEGKFKDAKDKNNKVKCIVLYISDEPTKPSKILEYTEYKLKENRYKD